MQTLPPWPYPHVVAHRGAGALAPENTLAAMRVGASFGYKMVEFDAKLSQDQVAILMHDTDLERTTDGRGNAADHPYAVLEKLDAGLWFGATFRGEPIPTLEASARYTLAQNMASNIEIKPTPGTEQVTGQVVAEHAAALWADADCPPLLTSFKPEALAGAKVTAPHLPRGLLLDTLWEGWLNTARQLECRAIVCHYGLWDASSVSQVHAAGMRCLSYTVNDEWATERLIELGTDGIITDRVDLFSPA